MQQPNTQNATEKTPLQKVKVVQAFVDAEKEKLSQDVFDRFDVQIKRALDLVDQAEEHEEDITKTFVKKSPATTMEIDSIKEESDDNQKRTSYFGRLFSSCCKKSKSETSKQQDNVKEFRV